MVNGGLSSPGGREVTYSEDKVLGIGFHYNVDTALHVRSRGNWMKEKHQSYNMRSHWLRCEESSNSCHHNLYKSFTLAV
ncbi:hypothetical protein ACLOJK_001711 [Asimina triloba]